MRGLRDDPARFLARRVRAESDLDAGPTFEDILRACRRRGVAVVCQPQLRQDAYYLDWPQPLIVLRRPDARACAHELGEHVLRDNLGLGITYVGPDWIERSAHEHAQRFEEELFGEASPE
jgi:hypothetical protein